MIYLDNAATSGYKPNSVVRAVTGALRRYNVNPGRGGYPAALQAAEAIWNTREAVADFFGFSDPARVVFTPGCTASLNYLLKGALKPGDHVLMSDSEHNAVARPVTFLERAGTITYDLFDSTAPDMTAELESKRKDNTVMVVCRHASNVNGQVLPLATIGAFCRRYGLRFCVDAAQSAGVLPVDMTAMGITDLCVAPHKGLVSPTGIGLLLAGGPVAPTVMQGGTGSLSAQLTQPAELPEALESGTLNLPGILGLKAGLTAVRQIGIDRIFAHESRLADALKEGLARLPGITLYEGGPGGAPVFSFTVEGTTSEEVAGYLGQRDIAVRAGLHCAPLAHRKQHTLETGTVRLAVGWKTTPEQVKTVLAALGEMTTKKS